MTRPTIWEKIKNIPFEYKFIFLLLLTAFLNDTLWMSIIPYNRAPDEYLHLQMVKFIYNNSRLPIYGVDLKPIFLSDLKVIVSPYASMPGLNYIITAVLGSFLSLFAKNISLLYIGRAMSMIFHLATIFFSYKIVSKLFNDNNFVKLGVPALLTFIPQMTFVHSYLNIDAFTIFTSTLLIFSLIVAKERQFNLQSMIFVGFSIGLVAFSKYNAYILIVLSLAYISYSLLKDKQKAVKPLVIMLLTAFILSGWWFVRNAVIYKGDLLGLNVQQKNYQTLKTNLRKSGIEIKNKAPLAKKNKDYFDLLSKTDWLEETFKSSWGYFDYMTIPLESIHYQILWLLSFFSLAGIIVFLQKKETNNAIKAALGVTSLIFFASLSLSLYSDYQPQGRYLFPGVALFLILFVFGLYNIFTRERIRQVAFVTFLAFFVYLNLNSFLNYIVPAYSLDLERSTPLVKQDTVNIAGTEQVAQSFQLTANNLNTISFALNLNPDDIETKRVVAERRGFIKSTISLKNKINGKPLRKKQLLDRLSDKKKYIQWRFLPLAGNYKKLFLVIEPSSPYKIEFPLAAKKYHDGKMYVNGKPTKNDMLFKLSYETSRKKLSIINLWANSKIKLLLFSLVVISSTAILAMAAFASFFKKDYIS